MGEEGRPPPLPVCDRCRHFVVRDKSVATCGPCRKAYQLQVSLRNVIPPGKDESAVVFFEGCFGLLEDWLQEIKGLNKRDKAAREERDQTEGKPREIPEKKPEGPKRSENPERSS